MYTFRLAFEKDDQEMLFSQAVENHPEGRLGFFSPNCNLHVINGGEIHCFNHLEISCLSKCFVGQLENIFVPDLNNPDVSLNAFQVWDKFETNCTKTQKLKQIAQRRKKTVVLLNRQ